MTGAGSRSIGWSPAAGTAARTSSIDNTAWGWQEPVEVEPGRTTRVRVGGRGRAVIGRLVLDGEPETPIDWTRNPPVVIHGPTRPASVHLESRQGRPVPHRGRPSGQVSIPGRVAQPLGQGRRDRGSAGRSATSTCPRPPPAGPTSRSTWGRSRPTSRSGVGDAGPGLRRRADRRQGERRSCSGWATNGARSS